MVGSTMPAVVAATEHADVEGVEEERRDPGGPTTPSLEAPELGVGAEPAAGVVEGPEVVGQELECGIPGGGVVDHDRRRRADGLQ